MRGKLMSEGLNVLMAEADLSGWRICQGWGWIVFEVNVMEAFQLCLQVWLIVWSDVAIMLCRAHLCTNDINGSTPNHRCWLTHFLGKPGPTSISKSYGWLLPLCKTRTLSSPEVCIAPDFCGLWSSLLWITGTAHSRLNCGSFDLERLQWAAANPKNNQKWAFLCVPQVYFCLLSFCLL